MWTIECDAGDTRTVQSSEELEKVLNEIDMVHRANRPVMVNVVSQSGEVLTIGLGADQSVLSYMPANGEPPYLSSVGNDQSGGTIVFSYFGDWTEIPRTSLIATPIARQVLRHFVNTGELSNIVTWNDE
jgi:hypothetical protein